MSTLTQQHSIYNGNKTAHQWQHWRSRILFPMVTRQHMMVGTTVLLWKDYKKDESLGSSHWHWWLHWCSSILFELASIQHFVNNIDAVAFFLHSRSHSSYSHYEGIFAAVKLMQQKNVSDGNNMMYLQFSINNNNSNNNNNKNNNNNNSNNSNN